MFLLSQQATNFYDFACYAKAKLNVEQLLYLDGTISHMYAILCFLCAIKITFPFLDSSLNNSILSER